MPTHVKAWVASYRSFGIDIAEEPFFEMGGLPNQAIIETLNEKFGYTLDVTRTQEEKERRYLEMMHTVKEIKAVADIARAHRGKTPIAVASSGLGRVVRETLTSLGLIDLFDVIVTADDVVHGKPSPDIFLLAAERLGVAPADCIVYEDGDPGLEAARRAEMRAVDVRVLWQNDKP
jgi:HAD superfamily hydrolase (TIGR01509 family)